MVTNWFPGKERASAIAMYPSGQFVGLAFLTPLLVTLQYYLGGRGLFICTGAIGIFWGLIWCRFYRDPLAHSRVKQAELEHIEKGGGIINTKEVKAAKKEPITASQFRMVFAYRKLGGVYNGQFAVNFTLWFFLTWFPTYLVQYRGFSFFENRFSCVRTILGRFCRVDAFRFCFRLPRQ